MNTLNNIICCIIAAATFAMIGIEYGTAPTTHSGTQPLSRPTPTR